MSYASEHADGIGCGELAAIMGLDHRRTPLDVWAAKRGLVEPTDDGDETTERGVVLERAVLDWFAKQREEAFHFPKHDFATPMRRGRLIGSPDAMAFDRSYGIEAKTRNYATGWGKTGTDEIPPAERAQVEGYLALTGAPVWYVAVLFGMPFEFRWYEIQQDAARSERILAFVENWWQKHVVEGEPPAVADTERSRLARLLNDKASKDVIRTDAKEVIDLMNERRNAEIERKRAQADCEVAEDRWRAAGGRIEELIGSAGGIETPVGSAYLNSRTSRGRLVTKWTGE